MLLKSGALTLTAVAETFEVWAVAAVLLGAGTAMVYSTRPAGVLADLQGIRAAIWAVAALTAASGVLAAVRMYETDQRAGATT